MDDPSGLALLAQLRRDAQAAVARAIETARAEAVRIRAHVDERVVRERTAGIAERERMHGVALERACSDARARTARAWLDARAEALDRVFVAAHEVLVTRAQTAEPRFTAAVARAAGDALAYLPPGDAVARCTPALAPAVREAVASLTSSNVMVSVMEDVRVPTGVLLETTDHALSIDATFTRRLDSERPRLAILVARALEAPGP